jgi:membrane carboxypeptidase/penicillin-binding protein PbpC
MVQDAKAQALAFRACDEPCGRQLDARYFIDHAAPFASAIDDGRTYLTVDGQTQRAAATAVASGAARLAARLGGSSGSLVQIALIAVDPRTGQVRAMIGGRSYELSQFNRATMGGRQVGSLIKPYDYLAAFERGAEEGVALSPDSIVADVPTVFRFAQMPWSPRNYGGQYGGSITWRHALAQSKNVAAVKVSAWAGFQRVADLWAKATGRPLGKVYPSFALGATEATPAQVAQAYTVFTNGGVARPLTFVGDVVGRTTPRSGPRLRKRCGLLALRAPATLQRCCVPSSISARHAEPDKWVFTARRPERPELRMIRAMRGVRAFRTNSLRSYGWGATITPLSG